MDHDTFELTLDLDTLTLGEIELIEETVGKDFATIAAAIANGFTGLSMGKTLRVFALVKMRRTDPAATWESTANIRPPKPKPAEPVDPTEPLPATTV